MVYNKYQISQVYLDPRGSTCLDLRLWFDRFVWELFYRNIWYRESEKLLVLAIVIWSYNCLLWIIRGHPRGVMVKAMDCGIVVREFVL